MRRLVRTELLDCLPRGDPRALRSRQDLRRLNRLMGTARVVSASLRRWADAGMQASMGPGTALRPAVSLVELGAGDGTFLLEAARRLGPAFGPVEATLVDQQLLLADSTREGFLQLGWRVEAVAADVFDWLSRGGAVAEIAVANLFLHHFDDERLSALLHGVSMRARWFIACDPRRNWPTLVAASLTGLIGCNAVTVHDGRLSVRAGFRGADLSLRWPRDGWRVREWSSGRFTHAFEAMRA